MNLTKVKSDSQKVNSKTTSTTTPAIMQSMKYDTDQLLGYIIRLLGYIK